MRNLKLENLKNDIEVLAQDHEREVDRKNAQMALLLRNLEETDEQFQVAQRSHMVQVDRLVELHDTRMGTLESEFESNIRNLCTEFETEIRQLQARHIREKRELNFIITSCEAQEREHEAEAKQENDTEREDIKTKHNDDTNMLRLTLEAVIDDLEKQFDEAHAQYNENTEKKTKDFRLYTDEDKQFSEQIDLQLRQIERLQTAIGFWRKKLQESERDGRSRNQQLKAEKDSVLKHYHELKMRMNHSRDNHQRKLIELGQWTRNATVVNEERISKAKHILKLAELARKLETMNEKVQPFLPSVLESIGHLEETLEQHTSEEKEFDGKESSEWTELDVFFRKYNRALLSKLAIEKEKENLEKENQDLRSILKQYLEGISVNAQTVNGPNSLLVVNGRVNLNQRPVRKANSTHPVLIEAIAVVNAYAAHR